MSTALTTLAGAVVSGGAASLAGLVSSPRYRVRLGALLASVMCAAALLCAGSVLVTGDPVRAQLPDLLPLAGVTIQMDRLGALFMALVAVVALAALCFGVGYAHGPAAGRTAQATVPLFILAMLLVPAAGDVATFALLWEAMALTSLTLVFTEHRIDADVRSAGSWYAVMTHLSLVLLLAGLLVAARGAGGLNWAQVAVAVGDASPAVRTAVFVLCTAGFAVKAGVVPVHVWLPRAHPAAPSHVSALMSGAMVKLGIYGVVRVLFGMLGGGPRWWGFVLLGFGAASALYGVLHGLVSTDIKRLLAFSTTENIGLIVIGIGAAQVLTASGLAGIGQLALVAALLHSVSHAVFKCLLFLGAGSVLSATGLRDLNRLGGLARTMPFTTGAVTVGALAMAALPPLSGFVSEWLLLQSLVHGLRAGTVTTVALPAAAAVVALTTGLSAAMAVRLIGTGFLARARSEQATLAHEVSWSMRVAMGILAALTLALGVAPNVMVSVVVAVARSVMGAADRPVVGSSATLVQLAGLTDRLAPVWLLLCVVAVIAVLYAGLHFRGVRSRRAVPAWACGRMSTTARMELTATSFAEPLQRVFGAVLRPDLDLDVAHHDQSRFLIDRVRYHVQIRDWFESILYAPLLRGLQWWGRISGGLQNGSIHRYIGYVFAALIIVLAVSR